MLFFLLLFTNIPAIEAIPTPTSPNILLSPVSGLDGCVVFELFSSLSSSLLELFPPWFTLSLFSSLLELSSPWFTSSLSVSSSTFLDEKS